MDLLWLLNAIDGSWKNRQAVELTSEICEAFRGTGTEKTPRKSPDFVQDFAHNKPFGCAENNHPTSINFIQYFVAKLLLNAFDIFWRAVQPRAHVEAARWFGHAGPSGGPSQSRTPGGHWSFCWTMLNSMAQGWALTAAELNYVELKPSYYFIIFLPR